VGRGHVVHGSVVLGRRRHVAPHPGPPRAQHVQPVPITKTGFCSRVGSATSGSQPAAVEMGACSSRPTVWPARP
jgi:hypothetical protein